MPAKILDGKKLSKEMLSSISKEISGADAPALAIVLVGNDPASQLYVSLKEKAGAEVGIKIFRFEYPENVDERTLVSKIRELNKDPKINGIIVQLPLPEHLNPNVIVGEIDPIKDADGFHPKNTHVIPPVVAGSLEFLKQTGETKGKRALVIAKSPVFSQTFCDTLREEGMHAEPTFPENAAYAKEFDIVVSAVGKPGLITKGLVRAGAVVIDVGTTRVNNKTVGDVSPDVNEVAGYLTPVPGGIGPMTVAMLLKNTVRLAKIQRGNTL